MVFLPPQGVKIRSEWQSILSPAEPFLLSPRDNTRAVLILYVGAISDEFPCVARSQNGITVNGGLADYNGPLEIYGPEEIWVAQTTGAGSYVTANFTYQALYYD